MTFAPFDPLEFKNTRVNDAALSALKREIGNILSSYVGWYDPFCELIQNSLDAVEARQAIERSSGTEEQYHPRIFVSIDLDDNSLSVTDNGTGLDKDKFEQFLAPNFSFKSGNTRGHKGVGATYVAYGFNYMRVTTKSPGFSASGRITGARRWLAEGQSGANPKVEPDDSPLGELDIADIDRGVSITVRFDDSTHPKKLAWLGASTADVWLKILSVKTGIGSVKADPSIQIVVGVKSGGEWTRAVGVGTGYLWLHPLAAKKARLRDINEEATKSFARFGNSKRPPDRHNSLDFIYENWSSDELRELLNDHLDDEERSVLDKHNPTISVEFGYTAKLWNLFNENLGIRARQTILGAGIQLAANNMPQGEVIQIPLNRYIGRQNQIHFLIHFDNYTPDLGRKGFHRELVDFAKTATRLITERELSKYRDRLRPNTGVAPNMLREMQIDDWKKDMLAHEEAAPIVLKSKHFFHPTEKVSITSSPTREQDVIALFHQLLAGGVIRGMYAMSTNERFTYDGLFKIAFDLDPSIYIFDAENNPLGVSEEVAKAFHGRVTPPRILEYKFSLNGLIEDFDSQDKNIRDVNLCIAWCTGDQYRDRYGITSLLVPENAEQREYHGVTHVLTDVETGSKYCGLIIIEELIEYLNEPEESARRQRLKYD
jgi:hypothetical protein